MPGGWGGPCVPAHEPYFYLFCHLADTVSPSSFRTHAQPHYSNQCEPARARARVVDLSSWFDEVITLGWPVALGFRSLSHQFPAPNYQRNTSGSLIIPAR